jgi:two-component system KDP operon response regulator KdpE
MELLIAIEETKSAPPTPQSKIMVVDDDADLCRALKVRLRAQHYQVVSASDGYSALALAQKERPDLVLLDLGLPGVDGFAVLKSLKAFPPFIETPVIILTGRNLQASYKPTLESGAAAYLQKPASNEELFACIRHCLQKTSVSNDAIKAFPDTSHDAVEYAGDPGPSKTVAKKPKATFERID